MTPLGKAALVIHRGMIENNPNRTAANSIAREAITAFLEAAAEDAGARVALQAAFYDNHSDTIAASRAAILALKETING